MVHRPVQKPVLYKKRPPGRNNIDWLVHKAEQEGEMTRWLGRGGPAESSPLETRATATHLLSKTSPWILRREPRGCALWGFKTAKRHNHSCCGHSRTFGTNFDQFNPVKRSQDVGETHLLWSLEMVPTISPRTRREKDWGETKQFIYCLITWPSLTKLPERPSPMDRAQHLPN